MSLVAWRAAAASFALHAAAHAGDVVVLPPGEPVAAWRTPLQLAGLAPAGDGDAIVTVQVTPAG